MGPLRSFGLGLCMVGAIGIILPASGLAQTSGWMTERLGLHDVTFEWDSRPLLHD